MGEGDENFGREFAKVWHESSDIGSRTESPKPGVKRELPIESAMSLPFTVRMPEEYNGVLLGINVTDAGKPGRTLTEGWALATGDPPYFRFIRLNDTAEES